ncbi:MAG: hypothetical protein HC821_05300, partial [Lewinella sp.]|nr:hypothetical protein [Lewinella sp.]
MSPSGGTVNLSSLAGINLWNQSGSNINYTAGNVGVGTENLETGIKLQVAGDLFVQSNLGNIQLGFPNNGNRWAMSTLGGGATLQWGYKPNGSNNFETNFRMQSTGELAIGDFAASGGWLQVRQNSTVAKTHLLLEETTANDFARLGFANAGSSTAQWHIAGRALDGTTGAASSQLNFYFTNNQGGADR